MSVSPGLLDLLKKYGHEGVHSFQIGLDRATDHEIIVSARKDKRIIITADLDFPRILALTEAHGPGIILFRGGNYSDKEMRDLLERVLESVSGETIKSSICVVDQKRIRIKTLPIKKSI